MKQKHKIISLDLFGTLVYYRPQKIRWALFALYLFVRHGITPKRFKEAAQLSLVTNVPLGKFVAHQLGYGEKDSTIFNRILKMELDSVRIFADAAVILPKLKHAGYELAIISNLGMDFWAPALATLPVKIDYVILSYKTGACKPSCHIFDELLDQSSVNPKDIIHIGDKLKNDYRGAVNSGFDALYLDRSGKGEYEDFVSIYKYLIAEDHG